MGKNFDLLALERKYENNVGRVRKIVKRDNHGIYPFIDEEGRTYTPEGRISIAMKSRYDLVRLLPEDRLAELEAKRAELDKQIEELKSNAQTVYCAVYTYGMSNNKLGVRVYSSDEKREEAVDRRRKGESPVISTFDLPFRKVDGKWEPAFEIVPK